MNKPKRSRLLIHLCFLLVICLCSSFKKKPCKNLNCQNGSNCVKSESGMVSSACLDGFNGEFCQNPCEAINCENGGNCFVNELGLPECDCPEGFTGEFCEEVMECFDMVCPSNVTEDSPLYDATNDTCYCMCAEGYEGQKCDIEIREHITGNGSGRNYNAIDRCNSDKYQHVVTIFKANTPSSSHKEFVIENFGDFVSPSARVVCEITKIDTDTDGNITSIRWIIPDHIDTDSDGDRIITSAIISDNIYYNIGTYNVLTGVLSITWSATFFDGVVDDCILTLEPF